MVRAGWLLGSLPRYDDIKQVSKDTDAFSIQSGMLITDVLNGMDALNTMFPDGVENFVTADPPRHAELRGLLNFAFSRRRVLGMQERAEQIVQNYLDKIEPGVEHEFVSAVSIPVPIKVVLAFMEIDHMSIEDAVRWSDDVFKMGSDMSEEEYKQIGASLQDMFAFFDEIVEARRKEPKDDFVGRLTASELDGKQIKKHDGRGLLPIDSCCG